MKKQFTLIFLFLLSFNLFGQILPVDSTTKKITYSDVIDVPGNTKDQLYLKAKNLGVSGSNVKADNKAEGTYVYSGQFKVKYPSPVKGMTHEGTVSYTFAVFLKDGKYKYVVTDLVHSSEKGNGGKLENSIPACNKYTLSLAGWSTIKNESHKHILSLIENFKENMKGSSGGIPQNTNDW